MLARHFRVLVYVCTVAVLAPLKANAQSGEDVAKGLLRALIESQLDRNRQKGGPPRTPGQGPPGGNNLSRRQQQPTPEIQQLRVITASFTQESTTLAALLNTDSRRSFEVRRLLPDAIRIQATATALKQQCEQQNHHASLLDGYRQLNSEWTTLSHQLNQCGSLSPQTQQCRQRISALDAQYCALLGLQQQFDNQGLVKEAYTLSAYLTDLQDNLNDTAPPPGTNALKLQEQVRRMIRQTDYFAGLASTNVRLPTVIAEYQTLYRLWQDAEPQMRSYPGHSVSRSVRKIQNSHRAIHELLRLTIGIDKGVVLHMIHDTSDQISQLFRDITLEDLMQLSDGDAVPSAADAMQGTMENLDDLVHRDQPVQAIGEAWAYADEAWQLFSYYLQSSRSPKIQSQLQTLRDSMFSLRNALGISIQFDATEMVNLAASLETLSERLVSTIRQWQTHPGNHNRTLIGQAQGLERACRELKQTLQTRRRSNQPLATLNPLIDLWQQIRPELKKCDTDERESFEHIAAEFTPNLIRLKTMLDD